VNVADITTTQRYAHLRLDNMRKAEKVLEEIEIQASELKT